MRTPLHLQLHNVAMKRRNALQKAGPVAQRFEQVVAKSNLSIEDFAKSIGVSKRLMVRLRRGALPKGQYLLKLREVHGVNSDWLLTGRGSMTAEESIDLQGLQTILLLAHLQSAAASGDQAASNALERYEATSDLRSLQQQIRRFTAQTILPMKAAEVYNSLLGLDNPAERLRNILPHLREALAAK